MGRRGGKGETHLLCVLGVWYLDTPEAYCWTPANPRLRRSRVDLEPNTRTDIAFVETIYKSDSVAPGNTS